MTSKQSAVGNILSDNLNDIIDKLNKSQEFEISFFDYMETQSKTVPINTEQYLRLLKYVRNRSAKLKIERHVTMDIIFHHTDNDYRIVLNGNDEINRNLQNIYNKPNNVIFQKLCTRLGKEYIIRKNKLKILDIPELFVRARVSDETGISESALKELIMNSSRASNDRFIFRHKQRVSLILYKNDKHTVEIDITSIKMSPNVNTLFRVFPNYEIELELFKTKSDPVDSKLKSLIYSETENILQVIQQSPYVITKLFANTVFDQYLNLLKLSVNKVNMLEGMQSVSLEVQHIIDNVPNKYNVTDKADGERHFLIVVNGECYLISNTLRVKRMNVASTWNDTIIDGELYHLPKYNKRLFLAFDILFHKGRDVRGTVSLLKRLELLDDVLSNGIVQKGNKYYQQKSVKLQGDELVNFYRTEYTEYFKVLNDNLKQSNHFIIQKKCFMNPTGSQDNEIFKFTDLIWNMCTRESICPYKLDGVILTPLEQKYSRRNKDITKQIYKQKPPENNSIDFYIKFIKDENGEIITLFDNSYARKLKGKTYQIAHLYVGVVNEGKEKYVLFQPKYKKYIAHLFLENGYPRDTSGEIIQDETVVEFYYDNNSEIVDDKFRWIPIKTRYDKTESVKKFGRRYGNSQDTADKVWRSIINPITFDDINALADDKRYSMQVIKIKEKVSQTLIQAERKESAYYQFQSELGQPMRDFHNWIKSNLVYTHCNPKYSKTGTMSVLDFACGRGGEIMKMFFARVDKYVGLDVSLMNLTNSTDGAISRLKQMQQTNRNFMPMFFIHADCGVPLDIASQERALGPMSEQNKQLIRRFFEMVPSQKRKYERFDRLSCQFAIHYFLKNDTVWNNFCGNVNKYLKPGGFMIITCSDAHKILEGFGEKDKISGYFNNNGKKMLLFEYIKCFETPENPKQMYKTGYMVDYHNSMFQEEGKYESEYLVDQRFLVKEFKDKCNMVLAETGTFEQLFNINKIYFDTTAKWESYYKTRNYLLDTAKFYDQTDEMNKVCLEMSKLNRYYVFYKLSTEKDDYDIKYKDWTSDSDLFVKKKTHKARFDGPAKTMSSDDQLDFERFRNHNDNETYNKLKKKYKKVSKKINKTDSD